MLALIRDLLPVHVPADPITEPPRRSADDAQKVIAPLQNQHRSCAADIGCDLAELVVATPWTVHVAQVHRDPVYPAPVAVNSEFDAAFNLPLQFLVPADMASADHDFHRYLPVVFRSANYPQLTGRRKR
ncbi:MAG: hypothetical protein ACM336_02395 [Acidobacteriota bacterium]